MEKFDDNKIIEGFKRGDNTVLEYVYAQYYKLIRWKLVRKVNLSDDEAKDIFQDALIILYKNIKQNDFVLKYSFKTYLYTICKHNTLKKLNLEMRIDRQFEFKESNYKYKEIISTDEYMPDEKFITEIKKKLIRKHFFTLGKDCQKILKLYAEEVPYEEIITIMGYSDLLYTIKRKHECKEILKKKIKRDLLYNKIKEILKDE